MNLSFDKLRHLWACRSTTLKADNAFLTRYTRILEIVARWSPESADLQSIPPMLSAEDNGIPTTPWSNSRKRLTDLYDSNPNLQTFSSQIPEVEELLLVEAKVPQFRIASNAQSESPHETHSTTQTQLNPESYYASYNYPFEIIRYFQACKSPGTGVPRLESCADEKFVTKFLWMLANCEEVLPILSLESFYALAPLFHEIVKGVAWGYEGYYWSLPFAEFTKQWAAVSSQLTERITAKKYSDLDIVEKRDLTKLLFVASLTDTTTKNALDMVRTGNKAMILYGPPGTGKTHQAQEVVRQLFESEGHNAGVPSKQSTSIEAYHFGELFPEPLSSSAGATSPLPPISVPGCWTLIQFHPNYSYQDFIGGITPELHDNVLGYKASPGIFKRFCDAAKANPGKTFVLIIDEINRADLSSVFGELMYALEYRNRKVTIPHFGQFEIPNNVYIIGTMNSADKSLVTFDLALRRRFLFFKLAPDMNVLHAWNATQLVPIHSDDVQVLIDKARKLNDAVTGEGAKNLELPTDYGIGQAYFMKIRDFCTQESDPENKEATVRRITPFAREQLWTYHLEPLLEEYLGAEFKTRKDTIQNLRDAFVKAPATTA